MYASMYVRMYACLYIYMYVCMYVCMCVSMYVCMCISTYACKCVCIYLCVCVCVCMHVYTWCDNKVRELIAVKVLHTPLLNTTMVAFRVLPLGSYAPMPAPSPPLKTIFEMVLWNGLQSCRCITPDVINVSKIPSFQYFLYLREQQKSQWGLDPVSRQGVPTQLFV